MENLNREKILVVDDDDASRRLLEVRLRALGFGVATADNGEGALAAVHEELPALILLDLQMPVMDGMELLRTVRLRGIDTPIIVVTAHGSIDKAVEAVKEGAFDFITKPLDPKRLEIAVLKALEREVLEREKQILSEEIGRRYQLVVGESEQMQEAVKIAKTAAASRATVLLLGESGTGKEIFARSIHNWSPRKGKAFVTINCVGLSEELLESELFGHERGAFTGANQLKKGKIELAHGGTVFLDEIGDISESIQTKFLRFLQEREFERVGGTRSISVDVRILAATNRDLEAEVKAGRFREDLFYRLNVVPIQLPALRDRKEDIPVLAQHFLKRSSAETGRNVTTISLEAQKSLSSHDWPGNVRELANLVERAVVLGNGDIITLEDLPPLGAVPLTTHANGKDSFHEAIDATKRVLLQKALSESSGNRAAAARALGLHEKYFLRLMKSLEINTV